MIHVTIMHMHCPDYHFIILIVHHVQLLTFKDLFVWHLILILNM